MILFGEIVLLILQPVIELFTLIAALLLELLVHLIAGVLSLSWLSLRSRGIERLAHILAAVTALHLLSALVLPFAVETPVVILSPVFSTPAITLSIVIFSMSILLPTAVDISLSRSTFTDPENADPSETSIGVTKSALTAVVPVALSYTLATALVLGGLSIWSSGSGRQSMREKICTDVSERIDEKWRDRAQKSVGFVERLLKRDFRDNIPCTPGTD